MPISNQPNPPVQRPASERDSVAPISKPNTVILTSGLTGSSVLAGLIARGGCWTGEATIKKEYDTFENVELVKLNAELLNQIQYNSRYSLEFSLEAIERLALLVGKIDEAPYRRFLAICNAHMPWVWKDPRLWVTVRFWAHLLPLNDCKFILLTRDPLRAWVSSTLRRHIRSYQSFKRYEDSVQESILSWVRSRGLSYLQVMYDDLIVRPEETITALNAYLNINLAVDDLRAVYQGPLYRAPRHSLIDCVKAGLIYLKNYSERVEGNRGG